MRFDADRGLQVAHRNGGERKIAARKPGLQRFARLLELNLDRLVRDRKKHAQKFVPQKRSGLFLFGFAFVVEHFGRQLIFGRTDVDGDRILFSPVILHFRLSA